MLINGEEAFFREVDAKLQRPLKHDFPSLLFVSCSRVLLDPSPGKASLNSNLLSLSLPGMSVVGPAITALRGAVTNPCNRKKYYKREMGAAYNWPRNNVSSLFVSLLFTVPFHSSSGFHAPPHDQSCSWHALASHVVSCQGMHKFCKMPLLESMRRVGNCWLSVPVCERDLHN